MAMKEGGFVWDETNGQPITEENMKTLFGSLSIQELTAIEKAAHYLIDGKLSGELSVKAGLNPETYDPGRPVSNPDRKVY